MKILIKKIKNNAGMSILELMIGLFLAGLVTASVFEVYINQHKNWMIQDDVGNIQQNGRAAIDELSSQLRMAGHELPLGIDAIEAYDTNPDTVIINFSSSGCNAPIEYDMGSITADMRCDGHDVSCFYDGQLAYIFHPDSGGGEFFTISGVQTGTSVIQHISSPLTTSYDKDAIVLALNRYKYYIDYSDSLHPNLMLELPGQTPQVYAENIEDLQFRYTMKGGAIVNVPPAAGDVREIHIDLTARSDKPDIDFEDAPYRKRSYATKVNLRNLL
ncbi:MAG: hypothetical protein GY865_07140 [candidate division Zixibacteria bacterium]|nr:hypothetical protein [candidate division Zixibacteria bacterium]